MLSDERDGLVPVIAPGHSFAWQGGESRNDKQQTDCVWAAAFHSRVAQLLPASPFSQDLPALY
jgi:hypothetical protein